MLQMQKKEEGSALCVVGVEHNVNNELYFYSIFAISTFLYAFLHMILCINLVPTVAQQKLHVFF